MKKPLIKILVCCHKPSVLPKDESFVPIHLGRQNAKLEPEEMQWMEEHMLGDNTGEHISERNDTYNEMTAVYWAWKNYDKLENPDFIGFTHYRRHFMFDEKQTAHVLTFQRADKPYFERLKLQNMAKLLRGYDVLAPKSCKWNSNAYEQYRNSPHHQIEDLDCVLKILYKKFPGMKTAAQEYLASENLYFCNMFIMKKKYFFDYCRYIFSILFEFAEKTNYTGRTFQQSRMYVSERLTAIYLYWLKKQQVPFAEIPVTMIENTQTPIPPRPIKKDAVSVVFSLTDAYAPYFAACLQSLVAHASQRRFYDLFVIDGGIHARNKNLLRSLCPTNMSLRFIDVKPFMTEEHVSSFFTHSYYDVSTYYRFYIPEIFKNFDKIIYLDADTIVLRDIALLFDTDISDKFVAATQDLYLPLWTALDKSMADYLHNKLFLQNIQLYFQAGVLLFNITQMRKHRVQQKLFDRLKEVGRPVIVDQDIFNSVCYAHVHFLDGEWNFDRNIEKFKADHPSVYEHGYPPALKKKYESVKNNVKIIHFAGPDKPWANPALDYAPYFWQYARQTPFYEEILFRNIAPKPQNPSFLSSELKMLANRHRTLCAYYRCKFLAKITWGKKRVHYKQKRDRLHEQVRQIRRFKQQG